jgi:uracil-DNA glycosylase
VDVKIEQSWKKVLQEEFDKPYFEELTDFVREEYGSKTVFPPPKDIFKAFDLCPFDQIKVVILGQDPYHGPGQAHGLCFSVNHGVQKPPSLVNIYKEVEDDIGKPVPDHGNLENWANQGVFLLNAILSVIAHQPTSHQNKGWETFTDEVIRIISEKKEHVVFMLWGAYAQSKEWMIDESKHLVLTAPHPSPLSASRGFFGCKHFSKANEYLRLHGIDEIKWA